MKTTNWKHLEGETDECSHPRCRATMQIIYSAGATPINRKKRVQLCDGHHSKFLAEIPETSDPRVVSTHTPDDKPESGKTYLLIGKGDQPSIARGDRLKDCEIKEPDPEPKAEKQALVYNASFDRWWREDLRTLPREAPTPTYKTPADMKEKTGGYCFRRSAAERNRGLTTQQAFEERGKAFGFFKEETPKSTPLPELDSYFQI